MCALFRLEVLQAVTVKGLMKATILVDAVPTKARQAVMSMRCTSTDLKKVKNGPSPCHSRELKPSIHTCAQLQNCGPIPKDGAKNTVIAICQSKYHSTA